LINNTQNAEDSGINTWYDATRKEGNYWDDYTEKYDATPTNNYWNAPYDISGGNNQDKYPLVEHYYLKI
jgi:hypothetical protein